MPEPNHPVIVASCQLANHTADGEPVAMMVEASKAALASTPHVRDSISLVAAVKGINPYEDPARLVADRLQLGEVETAYTPIGGNAPYDLLNHTAQRIADGEIAAAILCGAETMRTRRKDKAAGTTSTYLDEERTAPDYVVGSDADLTTPADVAAGVALPANFYALAESALRHRSDRSHHEHLTQIAKLWAAGSRVAAVNPHAHLSEEIDATTIATHTPNNRRIAAPYTKLLTSNVDVDQAAALVVCGYATAQKCGMADDEMVFLLSGAGASDAIDIRSRLELDRSNAMAIAGTRALELAGLTIDEVDHFDLYSCFPIAVQVARYELGIADETPFTITGGMTFAGGPFNTYCLQAVAHGFDLLRGTDDTALLHGNGGYFTKEAFVIASGSLPSSPFRYERPQALVDQCATRPLFDAFPDEATIEAYTVTFDRDDQPIHAILSVLDAYGSRHWATNDHPDDVETLLHTNVVGRRTALSEADGVPSARLL